MNLQNLFKTALILGAVISVFSFTNPLHGDDPKEMIQKMEQAMGGWDKMYALNDVQFTYNYEYPAQGKKDVSIEKYIFEGEHSWAKYTTHQINVLPEKEGEVIQSLIGNEITVTHNGEKMTDEASMGLGTFLRKANYYWFTMMYKLSDPGVQLSLLDHEEMNGVNYHKIKVEFNPSEVGKEVNDIYVLYLDPKTHLVDQFYFSLPAMGVTQPVILMKIDYETIDGVKVPSKRYIYQPNKEGEYGKEPNLVQTSSDIIFNNGFTAESFRIK